MINTGAVAAPQSESNWDRTLQARGVGEREARRVRSGVKERAEEVEVGRGQTLVISIRPTDHGHIGIEFFLQMLQEREMCVTTSIPGAKLDRFVSRVSLQRFVTSLRISLP
jgi:hypothetical protein